MKNDRHIDIERFGGIVRLYGKKNADRFANAHACVIGIGGVGSWAAEALARSGVGTLTLIDLDEICVTNTNRQIHTDVRQIGKSKAGVMAERLRAINPLVDVRVVENFVSAANVSSLIDTGMDVVVDAIDAYREKLAIIEHCMACNLPVVVAGAAGGRLDASKIHVDDLNRTEHDPLLRRVRKDLRKSGVAGPRDRRWGIPAVFSSETPRFPGADGSTTITKPDGNVAMDCGTGMGTVTHVTGAFGFHLADAALRILCIEPLDSIR